ncbi:DUF742 domain-containing protein [Streptosporangium lutulentum]
MTGGGPPPDPARPGGPGLLGDVCTSRSIHPHSGVPGDQRLVRQVRSVAEISAMLRIPLGVTRILVADMAAEGLVQLHQPQLDAGKPDLNLLERVLSGLRRL